MVYVGKILLDTTKKTFHSQYQYMKNKKIKNKCIIHSPVRHTGARVYNIGITTEEVQ